MCVTRPSPPSSPSHAHPRPADRARSPHAAIGIIGATVMPHSLFLGSALATQDRVAPESAPSETEAESDGASSSATETDTDNDTNLPAPALAPVPDQGSSRLAALRRMKPTFSMKGLKEGAREVFRVRPVENAPAAKSHADWTNRPIALVRGHLYHGIIDMVVSLLGLAVVINAL